MSNINMSVSAIVNQTSFGSDIQNVIVGLLEFAVGMVAFASHMCVVVFTFLTDARKHQVSFLIASGSVAELLLGLHFGVWQALAFALQQPLGSYDWAWLGYCLFGATNMNSLVLSVNRYFATSRPHTYIDIFSAGRTKCYVLLAWVLGIGSTVVYGVPACKFYWDIELWSMVYIKTACGHAVQLAAEFFGIIAALSVVINLFTLRQLRNQTRKVAGSREGLELRRRQKREMRFFIQSCVTCGSDAIVVLSLDYLSLLVWTRWPLYILTAFIPTCMFAVDGVVLVFLNGYIRKAVMATFCGRRQGSHRGSVTDKTSGGALAMHPRRLASASGVVSAGIPIPTATNAE